MSDRRTPESNDWLTAALKRIEDRLWRLENGGATAGVLSLGDTIYIGTVQIQVVETGPTSANLVFTNIQSGASYSISL